MEYLHEHWRLFHVPVSLDSCFSPDKRKRDCLWLLENTCSFDAWVLSVWLLDRCDRPRRKLARVACACVARKYHGNDFYAAQKRNCMILGSIESFGYSLKQVMLEETRVMRSVRWTVPSFQLSACLKAIAAGFFQSPCRASCRVLKQLATNWLLLRPLRSCAWICIVPAFAALRIMREDDTKWLRALAKAKVSHSPTWIPVGTFIELANRLS